MHLSFMAHWLCRANDYFDELDPPFCLESKICRKNNRKISINIQIICGKKIWFKNLIDIINRLHDWSLIGPDTFTSCWIGFSNFADVSKAVENFVGLSLHKFIGHSVLVPFETTPDIFDNEQLIGIILNLGGQHIILHIDLAGRYNFQRELVLLGLFVCVCMGSEGSASHWCVSKW